MNIGQRYWWAFTWAFRVQDLFSMFDRSKLSWGREFYKLFKSDDWQASVSKVFCYFMYLVIDDIIENNVTFEFPMNGNLRAELYVKTFMGEDFRILYKLGKWAGIDFLKSEFTGYQIYFKYKTRNGRLREKPVYISRKSGKDKFYQKINEGKKYY